MIKTLRFYFSARDTFFVNNPDDIKLAMVGMVEGNGHPYSSRDSKTHRNLFSSQLRRYGSVFRRNLDMGR